MIPETREEALQLKRNPCHTCNVGWGSFSKDGVKSCRDNCEYLKRYFSIIQFGMDVKPLNFNPLDFKTKELNLDTPIKEPKQKLPKARDPKTELVASTIVELKGRKIEVSLLSVSGGEYRGRHTIPRARWYRE